MRLMLAEIAKAINCPPPSSSAAQAVTGVSTDTRTVRPGDLFIALIGEKSDGHQFVAQAVEKGAVAVIVSQEMTLPGPLTVFRVPDTEIAYGQLARCWRGKFAIPVIAVTGSVGKTTTKEMIAAALAPLGPVLKTAASQNTETGVPKTLLQLTGEHRAAVIEMGMRGAGQIAYLCGIARPTMGVITVISDTHIELLGSRDAIADAKGELLEALPESGIAVLNADDSYYNYLSAKTKAPVITFGACEPATFHPTDEVRTEAGWAFSINGARCEIASPSRHDIGNAAAAFAVAATLGVPPEAIADSLSAYQPPPMRMQVLKAVWDGTILNDAYNAAPASVRSALHTLHGYAGVRKIAFLGDMRELGDYSKKAHQEIGAAIAELGGFDALYTVGALAAHIPAATRRFADSAEAAQFARQTLGVQPDDVILVKGSRAVAMESIVEALMACEAAHAS